MHLASVLRAFGGYRVAVELRHRSWSDTLDRNRSLLEAFHATWTWIDEPKFRDSVRQPDIEPAAWAYLRFRGRNVTAWWHSQDRDERYRYAYAERPDGGTDKTREPSDPERPPRVAPEVVTG